MIIFTYLKLTDILTCVGHISLCGDPVVFGYACSKRVSTSLLFLATEFLSFNIEANA